MSLFFDEFFDDPFFHEPRFTREAPLEFFGMSPDGLWIEETIEPIVEQNVVTQAKISLEDEGPSEYDFKNKKWKRVQQPRSGTAKSRKIEVKDAPVESDTKLEQQETVLQKGEGRKIETEQRKEEEEKLSEEEESEEESEEELETNLSIMELDIQFSSAMSLPIITSYLVKLR